LPLRHRHGYAAALHHGLPTGKINPIQEFPPTWDGAHRDPAQIHRVRAGGGLEGLYNAGSSRVHLPVSLAGPAPSGSTGTSRRCRGCSPPDPADSPNPATPSFNRPAATERRRGSHTRTRSHSASWRTVSHLHSINKRLTAHRRIDGSPDASVGGLSAPERAHAVPCLGSWLV
jgi:hypothetical protein